MERPRILLVDDVPEILALCSEILRPHYEIVGTAPDGESAIAVFETTTPDAVVLDISMPKLDGIEVARRLRSSGSSRYSSGTRSATSATTGTACPNVSRRPDSARHP